MRNQTDETRTLIHEFGHLVGAPDHYAGNLQGNTNAALGDKYGATFSDYCIYGNEKDQLAATDPYHICDGCQSAIKKHIENEME